MQQWTNVQSMFLSETFWKDEKKSAQEVLIVLLRQLALYLVLLLQFVLLLCFVLFTWNWIGRLLSLNGVLAVFSYAWRVFVVVCDTQKKHRNTQVYLNTQPMPTIRVTEKQKCQTQTIHHHTQQKTILKPKIFGFLSIVNYTSIFF